MAQIAIPLALTVGGMVLQQLFAPKQTTYGSRLADINVPAVSPGNKIIRHWGIMKLPGQILWTSKLIETEHKETSGGKGGPKQTQVTYTYSVDCAIGICAGPVATVLRVRANQKLVWVNPAYQGQQESDFEEAYYSEGTRLLDQGVDVDDAHVAAFFFAFNNYRTDEYTPGTKSEAAAFIASHPLRPDAQPDPFRISDLLDRMFSDLDKDATYEKYKKRFDGIAIYLGTNRQLPDPTIESYKGVGNVPAFRGTCYMVLKNLQLEDFGNTIPTFQVEVKRNDGTIELHEIIADICRESGLDDTEFNVTCGLQSIPVHGFAMTDIGSGRDAIQALQKVYPFDATETAYTIRFGWMEKRPQAIIRREDFAAHMMDDDLPPSEEVIRVQDYDLPKKMTLQYQEPARNYSLNTVVAQRQVTESNLVEEIKVPIALTREEAKSRIEGAMVNRFLARRTYKINLPRKYVILEPGDAVLVPDKDNPEAFYGMRLLQVAIGANGLIEAQFSDHFYHDYVEAIASEDIIGDDDEEDGPVQGSRTYAYMLDTPLLTDTEDDNIGFYTVLSGTRKGWSGGVLVLDFGSGGEVPVFGASDPVESNGSTWYTVARNSTLVPHGFVMNQLGPAVPTLWDTANKITVKLLDPDQLLTSYTKADLLVKPVNVAVVRDELIQFADAIDKGNGIWELRTLLRGQRGTEWAIPQHILGDRFVLLDASAINRIKHDQSMLNILSKFRAISLNEDPDTVEDIWFANSGNSLRPYAPHVHSAIRDGEDNITLDWLPRVRQNGGMFNGQETQLDQPFERYEIDVMSGDFVVRTETVSDARAWSYPASTMLADFSEIRDIITVRIYQIGQIVGRGFAAEVTV